MGKSIFKEESGFSPKFKAVQAYSIMVTANTFSGKSLMGLGN